MWSWASERFSDLPRITQQVRETYCGLRGFPGSLVVKNPPAVWEMWKMWVQSLGQEHTLKRGMATHFLAWKIAETEEPGGLQSMESKGVGRDLPCTHALWYVTQQSWSWTTPPVPWDSHNSSIWKSSSAPFLGISRVGDSVHVAFLGYPCMRVCNREPPGPLGVWEAQSENGVDALSFFRPHLPTGCTVWITLWIFFQNRKIRSESYLQKVNHC